MFLRRRSDLEGAGMRESGENPEHRPVLSVYENAACGESRSLGKPEKAKRWAQGWIIP